eukprot:3375907-Pleurochrysis_carterae.AAC.1
MGVPQQDGGLPATVVRANIMVKNCVRVAIAVRSHGGQFVFESPVGRGANSRFAMNGKNEHVDMSTHNDLAKLADMHGVGRVYFDQCVFGASSSKTTQLIANAELLSQLKPRFAEKFCPHPHQARTVLSSE